MEVKHKRYLRDEILIIRILCHVQYRLGSKYRENRLMKIVFVDMRMHEIIII